MGDPLSSKDQILELIRANPFIQQQELAERLGITRSAIASHIAQLIRDGRLLGRAYLLPTVEPILVVGGANVDRIAKSLGPVAMASSNPVVMEETFGGVARNVAENLARMGLPVRLMTAVGDDVQGAALLKHARETGIDTGASLIVNAASTGTYTAMLRPDGEMVVAMADMAVMDSLLPEVLHGRRSAWAATRMRVVDLNLPKAMLAALLEESRDSGATLVAVAVSEPKMNRLPERLSGISTLILNVGELEARLGRRLRNHEAAMACSSKIVDQGASSVIVTLGAEGVIYCDGVHGPRHLKAPRARIVNVTGAGDAFSAGVVASLFQCPGNLARACRFGQKLSALTLGCRESVAPSLTPTFLPLPPESRIDHA